MDAERQLVARAAHSGHVDQMLSRGVDPSHFADDECRGIWEWMRDHTMKYKSAPSLKLVREQFPGHNFEIVSDSTDWVIDQFIKNVKRRLAAEALKDIATAWDDDTQVGNIDEIFLERARELSQVVPAKRVSQFSNMKERIKAYHDMRLLGKPLGIPFGIPAIDSATLGLQRHELVSIAGWQGTGKTTLMLQMLFSAYLAGENTLLISLEMEGDAVMRKLDVMATNIEYHAVKAGTLGDPDLAKWETMAEKASKASTEIHVIDDIGRCTVDRVYAEMVKYNPGVTGVDYISLMHTREGQAMWEKITYLTGALKQTTRALKSPIIAACQTNIAGAEGGAALSNIAYSRSIGQDSDLVFGLNQDAEMKQNKRMDVMLLKNRDGKNVDVKMHWDMETMEFWEVGVLDSFTRSPKESKDGE